MSPRIAKLAVLRSLKGLLVLSVHRRSREKQDVYEEELAALSVTGADAHLAEAWATLSAVREIKPGVLDAVETVLRETVVDLDADRPQLASLDISPPPTAYKSTAANPRAYKGTHDRPPKPRRPDLMDLRPFLCVTGGQDRLIAVLSEELGAIELPHEVRGQPSKFRRYFETVCRTTPYGSSATAAYHQLGLEGDTEMRRSIAFLFATCPDQAGAWSEFLVATVYERRQGIVDLLWKTGAVHVDPSVVMAELVSANQHITSEQFSERMRYLLDRFTNGESEVQRVLSCFRLLDDHLPEATLDSKTPPPTCEDLQAIEAFVDRFQPEDGHEVFRLVRVCGETPQFGPVLRVIFNSQLPAPDAVRLARVLSYATEDFDPEEAWRNIRANLGNCISALDATPVAHRKVALDILFQGIWGNTTSRFEFILALLPIVCVPPFATDGNVEFPIMEFAWLKLEQRTELLKAPASSFSTLQDRSVRNNDALLIGYGLGSFVEEAPDLVVTAFATAPGLLVRVARSIGLLSKPVREELIREVVGTPLFREPAAREALDAATLVQLIDEHGGPEAKSYIPRALRMYVQGETKLRPGQIERHVLKIHAAWPAVCCSAIHELGLMRLSNGLIDTEETDFGDLSNQMSHALMLQASVVDNRRSLRRLIRACYEGNTKYLEQHALNQAWIAAHPDLPLREWLTGIQLQGDVDGPGAVTLSLESDPLEALRLGTYVGSCLGLGGEFTWSAAATVLDINKQVVFARDANGGFLARQILGITNCGELACYEVYPKVGSALLSLFRDYDQAIAKQLGIKIMVEQENPTDEQHEANSVRLVLAQDWWDDGVWDHSIND